MFQVLFTQTRVCTPKSLLPVVDHTGIVGHETITRYGNLLPVWRICLDTDLGVGFVSLFFCVCRARIRGRASFPLFQPMRETFPPKRGGTTNLTSLSSSRALFAGRIGSKGLPASAEPRLRGGGSERTDGRHRAAPSATRWRLVHAETFTKRVYLFVSGVAEGLNQFLVVL